MKSNKPLKNFSHHAKIDKNKLDSDRYCKLNIMQENIQNIDDNKKQEMIKYSNLYVLTHQLVGDKEECEIEDLFDEKTLNHTINGRSFSRKDENKNKFYNKDNFS